MSIDKVKGSKRIHPMPHDNSDYGQSREFDELARLTNTHNNVKEEADPVGYFWTCSTTVVVIGSMVVLVILMIAVGS